ncbi:SDR family oxidoreductase [Sphingobacterium paramultivorum]|uniref:SDR family oxidoreductase n=1 Tax=Sphingobacterium paramultivorum TaxID=2886510 RepID=UPI00129C4716|nr:SDR family oxidoreductase [Sphingobacterium paramultivorum]
MKVFITGASGFIGSAVVQEMIDAGHQVTGLARSEKSAEIIANLGAKVIRGDLQHLDILKQAASNADAVIHTGFSHDLMFANEYAKAAEIDINAINAMGEVLLGTQKPLVVTAGTLGLPLVNGFVTEESTLLNSPRGSEPSAMALAAKGVHASVVRLPPSVHGSSDLGFMAGFTSSLIQFARNHGVSTYPLNGDNRWPAVHRLDAAKVFCKAAEKAEIGALYNAIGETGIKISAIAELIGTKLHLPVTSLRGEDIVKHFQWLSHFITFDSPATSFETQQQLNWSPTHIGLLEDVHQNYL